jgi:hypothetical protein
MIFINTLIALTVIALVFFITCIVMGLFFSAITSAYNLMTAPFRSDDDGKL